MKSQLDISTFLLLGLALTAGCAGTANGAREATAADRTGRDEGRFACGAPAMMTITGSTVDEHSSSQGDLRIFATPGGLVAVAGQEATTNHWLAPDGDHFFSWFASSEIGAETIVDPKRAYALSLLWTAQPEDATAYVTQQFPDGTTRPSGTPMEIFSCLNRGAFDEQRKKTGLGFTAIGATPVPADAVGPHTRYKVLGCSRKGGAIHGVAVANLLPDWGWVPYELFVPVGSPSAFLSFERLPFGKTPVWQVETKNQGQFVAQLGEVTFVGRFSSKDGKPIAQIVGSVTDHPEFDLYCIYDTERQ